MKKVISILLVGLMLFGLTACGKSGKAYEKPIATFYDALEDKDYDKMVSAFTDTEKEFFEMALANSSKEELMESMYAEIDGDVKISFKVIESTPIKGEELDSIKEEYGEVEEAYILEVETTTKTSSDKETSTDEMTVVKIGGKWYLSMM
jgi:hypothetical protein